MKQKVVHFARLAAVLCLLLGMWGPTALAQKGITVKGSIVDADGLPVIGAGVTLKGTTTGVAADFDGNFVLTVPGETAVLEFSALGYVTQEVTVGKQRNFTIVMRDDTQTIEATVVVAYGTQTKATVTGALTSIDNKALIKAPVADVTNVLAGQMPGVSTVQETGQPGEDYAKIYIRGSGSLSDSNASPLILVDGVERPMNTVDPNEIESLSILKDAASTAVFGVRGANGVIIVTTKRGDAGKPKISVSSITGVQVPMSYITQCSSYDFARYYNVYQWNDGKTDPGLYFTPEAIEAYRTGSDPLFRAAEKAFYRCPCLRRGAAPMGRGSERRRADGNPVGARCSAVRAVSGRSIETVPWPAVFFGTSCGCDGCGDRRPGRTNPGVFASGGHAHGGKMGVSGRQDRTRRNGGSVHPARNPRGTRHGDRSRPGPDGHGTRLRHQVCARDFFSGGFGRCPVGKGPSGIPVGYAGHD